MSWKEEIIEYYESRAPNQIWNTKEEAISYFEKVVIPAFEEISKQLKPFVINVSIKKEFFKHTFKASIEFKEKEIKYSFMQVVVKVGSNSINLPYGINNVSSPYNPIDVESEEDVGKEFIISEFMKFFISREEQVKEHNKYDAIAHD